MPTPNGQHYDVIIAGARCAGAATAMLLARQGARVLLLDRSRYGTDTLSTHALMRGAVLQLHRWGLLPRVIAAGTPAVRSTTFHLPAAVPAVEIKPRDGVDALYAPRRVILDAILADAARSAGAELRFGTSVTGLRRDRTGRVTGIAGRPARRTWRSAPIWSSAPITTGGPDAVCRYQEERDALSLRLFRVTGRIASVDWTADDIGGHLLELKDAMAEEVAAMTGEQLGDPGRQLEATPA